MTKKFPWYTGKGDDGNTGLLGEGRVPKYHPQPEAFGEVDEASSLVGFARSLITDNDVDGTLLQVQRDCYGIMSELAAAKESQAQFRRIGEDSVVWVTGTIDTFAERVEMPREFVVPGGSPSGAALDVARAVVRRAERRVAWLLDDGVIENRALLAYLNRLSSLLFILARYCDNLPGGSGATLARDDS